MATERILVVDDEPTILRACQRALESEGYQTETAQDGASGLERAREHRYDVVLMDINLPDSNGLDVYAAIKGMSPDTAGIVITGYDSKRSVERALNLGMSRLLCKPFSLETLRQTVRATLDEHRKARDAARARALNAVSEVGKAILSTLQIDTLFQLVLDTAVKETNADAASLMLVEDGGEHLVVKSAVGLPRQVLGEREPLTKGIAGWVARHRRPLVLGEDARLDPALRALMGRREIASGLSVPILWHDQVLGVLNVSRFANRGSFTQGDLELISVLADNAAIALQNSRLFQEVGELFLSTTRALASAIDAKDPYTHGHSQRVCQLAESLATALSWRPDERDNLRLAALLHDIGKIGTPDSVLRKEGKLDDTEWEEIKKHPHRGSAIVENIRNMHESVLYGIRHHHERYDGDGYPEGLGNGDIPATGRIIAVADAFEAMTSDRPYRKGMPKARAMTLLREGAGSQWDPQLVAAFMAVETDQPSQPERASRPFDSRLRQVDREPHAALRSGSLEVGQACA